IALPPRPRLMGAIIATRGAPPRPSEEAIGMPARMWAASSTPNASLSRIAAQDASRTRLSRMPSSCAKPISCATAGMAQSTRGVKPKLIVTGSDIASDLQFEGGDDALGDVRQFAVPVHGRTAKKVVGAFLVQPLLLHQKSLRPLHHLPVGELRLCLVPLAPEAAESIEARHRQFEDRLDPLLPEPVDDVGADARLDRGMDGGRVALVDEHRDR